MKKWFPHISDHIGGGYIFCIFAVWLVVFVVVYSWFPMIMAGLWENPVAMSWAEVTVCGVLGLVMMALLKEHLKDAWLYFSLNKKLILKPMLIALGLMVAWAVISVEVLYYYWIHPVALLNAIPVSPITIMMTSGSVVQNNPVAGTLVMTLLVPFSVCAMFYSTAFAPVCTRNRWLGYLTMAAVALLAVLGDVFWYAEENYAVIEYLLRLPIHMFACWAYQKTDNILAPIMTLGAFNFLASLAAIFLM